MTMREHENKKSLFGSALLASALLLALMGASAHAADNAEEVGPFPGETEGLLVRSLDGAMSQVEEIVFAVRAPGRDHHWYANFGYRAQDPGQKLYGKDGGQLCRLNLRTGDLVLLVDDPRGGVRDPVVSYDASKILFSYRKGGTEHYHLYEIGVDGRGLRQITDGEWADIEPI